MFFIDELDSNKLYKRNFLLPIDEKNKKKHGICFLMGTSYQSSKNLMNYKYLVNKYYNSYYVERAVLYYINQESGELILNDETILNESIDSILGDNDRYVITYKGYTDDVNEVSKIITPDMIKEIADEYGIKVPKEITVQVMRRQKCPPSTKDTIYVSSRYSYNKRLKNYNAYLKFCVMESILSNIKKLNKSLAYGTMLYDSDMYFIHKTDWIFGNNFKTLCRAIDFYVKKNNHKTFARQIVMKNNITELELSTFKDFIFSDIDNIEGLLGIKESNDEFGRVEIRDTLQLNESCILAFNEDATVNPILKKALYADRMKTTKDLTEYYEKVKEDNPNIKYTYLQPDKYKSLNLFVDLATYNESYIRNTQYKGRKGYTAFLELMKRLITDTRYTEAGYTERSIMIPIEDWDLEKDKYMWMIKDCINPISCIYQLMTSNETLLKEIFGNTTVIFVASKGYFKINFSEFDSKRDTPTFLKRIKTLRNGDDFNDSMEADMSKSSPKAIKTDIVDQVEKSQGVEINNISASNEDDKNKPKDKKEKDKQELVDKIDQSSKQNTDVDSVLDELDNDERLKQILANLSEDPDTKSNISAARASRIIKLNNDFEDKQFKGKPIRELLKDDESNTPLPVTALKIDTVNDEWKNLTYCNTIEAYNPDKDIVGIFRSFSDMTHPLSIVKLEVEDTSTTEDITDTYTVQYENENGKRFTIVLDIPRFVDNKYLKLRGNRKDIPGQLFLMPIIKTDEDTVQIVSNYNKIFIRRFGTTSGKSNKYCDMLMKTLNKHEFKNIKIFTGDNSRICSKYELPIDYIDLSSAFSKIETTTFEFYFNQDELRRKFGNKIDDNNGVPVGIIKKSKDIIYFTGKIDKEDCFFAQWLAEMIDSDDKTHEFIKIYKSMPEAVRYTYSKASIMNSQIPLIIICAYSEGLTKVLNKANIKFRFVENKRDVLYNEDYIKFNDGLLVYQLDYASSLLMNGLKACDTSSYSLADMNNKGMYLDFLDDFGGRIKADGLDNFYNLMIDKPITVNTLNYYKLPTDYIEVLLYANRLLADNKYNSHTKITNNRRIRRNEQVPAILYKVLSSSYAQYCNGLKHGHAASMSVKRSAVIDEVLLNSTTSDKSIINALNEYEAYAAVTPKGPSGMNSDRSYTLDKRAYDDSMVGVMALSTGFASNVGITRQATIDSNVSTVRGYIVEDKSKDKKELNPTKDFCMTEALTPYGVTRDDPFRSAMTFIQTSKHAMRCKVSHPSLISSGADEALPYLISDIFAVKAKDNGKVIELDEDRMIIEYKNGEHEYVVLSERVEKNSSNGKYTNLKLDTDLKVGSTVKKGEVVAYDKLSFSRSSGSTDDLSYTNAIITKFAILNTDEGFEDSTIISESLCDAMTSEVVIGKDIDIPKSANIYNLVKKGQKIQEGDTLMILQAAYDEEDINTLLKNLADDEEEITNLGRVPIKSKVTGVVQDVIIKRTCDIDELSPTLKKIVTEYEKGINAKRKELKKYGIKNESLYLESTEKLPMTGKLKGVDGIHIEIYLMYEDRMKVGDKLVVYSANKGVVKEKFPVGLEPTSSYRPNEKIHALLSEGSVNARMVTSIIVNGGIYKAMIELTRQCKDILGIKYDLDII